MELRKDPITRSWVITGDTTDTIRREESECRFCAGLACSRHTYKGKLSPGPAARSQVLSGCQTAPPQPGIRPVACSICFLVLYWLSE